MIKILFLILTASNLLMAYDLNDYVYFESAVNATETSPKLNPATKEPLPGSTWTVKMSGVFDGNCQIFTTKEYTDPDSIYVFDYGDEYKTLVDYLDPSETNCDNASYVGDPDGEIDWIDLGLEQRAEFGTEVLVCGQGQACGITQDVEVAEQNYTTINPTPGVDGTAPGKADIFSYIIDNSSYSNIIGYGGSGGAANLPMIANEQRYCIYLRDAVVDGLSSAYAKAPYLHMYVYTWNPVKQGAAAAPGLTPNVTGEKIRILKGLDSSTRYWIKKDHIINVDP